MKYLKYDNLFLKLSFPPALFPVCSRRIDKRTLYKTAFSPQYNCYVSIKSVEFDSDGKALYRVSLDDTLTTWLLREESLTKFCL